MLNRTHPKSAHPSPRLHTLCLVFTSSLSPRPKALTVSMRAAFVALRLSASAASQTAFILSWRLRRSVNDSKVTGKSLQFSGETAASRPVSSQKAL